MFIKKAMEKPFFHCFRLVTAVSNYSKDGKKYKESKPTISILSVQIHLKICYYNLDFPNIVLWNVYVWRVSKPCFLTHSFNFEISNMIWASSSGHFRYINYTSFNDKSDLLQCRFGEWYYVLRIELEFVFSSFYPYKISTHV